MGCARQRAFTGPLLCGPSRRAARPRLLLLLLLAVGLRVLVPVGFMPATDGTLSVMICQDGFPPVLQTHQQGPRQGGHGDADGDDYCSFTTGFSSAPPPVLVVALAVFIVCLGVVLTRLPTPAGRLTHTPQARGPPAPL
jgi:Protein of unknown function (DUF2946)